MLYESDQGPVRPTVTDREFHNPSLRESGMQAPNDTVQRCKKYAREAEPDRTC